MPDYHFSDWELSSPLLNCLRTEKVRNLVNIINWGWYTVPHIFIDGRILEDEWTHIREFIESANGRKIVVRVLPRYPGIKAATLLDHTSFNEIKAWLLEIKNLENYILLINSHGNREWVGNIIASSDGVVIIEIMPGGRHVDLDQSHVKKIISYNDTHISDLSECNNSNYAFLSIQDSLGRILHHPLVPTTARMVVWKMIKRIQMTRGECVPGFYEFVYGPEDGAYFIDAIFEPAYYMRLAK